MKIFITLFKIHLRIIYFFIKITTNVEKRIVFISRQSNKPGIDFRLLKKEIKKKNPDYQVEFLCRKFDKDLKAKVHYYFHLYKQMYYLATSEICMIDSYCIPVSILKHKEELKIVQIWHSLGAIKKFGFQTINKSFGRNKDLANAMDMHKNYDVIVCGSNAMIPYYCEAFNATADKIKVISLPRIDYLINEENHIRNKITNSYPNMTEKKVILYAPTFREGEQIPYDNLLENVDLDKYSLIIKGHPVRSGEFFDDRIYTCPEFSSLQLLTVADYVITDYSAISIEASILRKPLYFYVYDYEAYKEKNGLNLDLYEEMPGCVFEDISELMGAIKHTEYNIDLVEHYRDKYISHQEGRATKALVDYMFNLNALEKASK